MAANRSTLADTDRTADSSGAPRWREIAFPINTLTRAWSLGWNSGFWES